MPDHYIHLTRREKDLVVRGNEQFAAHHDITSSYGPGVFAEWVWDGSCLRAGNCRYGIYPLYYFSTPDEVVISTSLVRMLTEGAPQELDDCAVALFLRTGCFMGDDTAFQAIRILPPNARLEWRPGAPLSVSGGPTKTKRQDLTRDEAIDAFIELFRAAVRRRPPQGDFAVPLSGGRDSRHILLELCEAGHRPKVCLTMRHFPPRNDEDARVAAIVAEALGVEHEVRDPAASRVELELRKNPIMGFCTDWSAWFLSLLDRLQGHVSEIYSGYGGDALTRGLLGSPSNTKRVELWLAGNTSDLATFMLTKRRSSELALELILKRAARDRFSLERARTRLIQELDRHVDQPNPDLAFTFQNALRRRTGPHLFPMASDIARISTPYLDHSVYDLLASLPIEMLLDRDFHTEAIWRAFPRYKDIPFTEDNLGPRNDVAHFGRMASELTMYALSRGTSSIFNIPRLVERLSGCRRSGDGKIIRWLQPSRILCLLQLERTIEAMSPSGVIA